MKLTDLHPYDRNPRQIKADAMDRLKQSISRDPEFMALRPIVHLPDGTIIGGNQRWRACCDLGMDEIPDNWCRNAGEMPEERWRRFILLDNSPGGMSGEWVTEMLAEDWSKELLEEVGLDDILADIIRGEEKDKELDEEKPLNAADELNKKWKVENGDLWLIGKNRLICGDSTNSDVVDRLMNGEKWSLMPTDPPYGVSVVGGTHDPRDKSNYKSGSSIANDELTGEDLEKLISQSFSVAANHGSPGASWYCWYAGSQTRAVLDACERLGGMRHVLVWVKQNFVFGRSDYHYRHEPVMYGWLPGGSHRWFGDRKQDSVWECDAVGTDLDKKQHPTSKPVELASKPIRNHTEVGDVVYDPFLGSGTTMVAAQHLDRVCFGVELSPSFCAVILERMSNAFAGIKIEKLDK